MKTKRLNNQKKRLFYAQLHKLLHAGMSFTSSFSIIVDGANGYEKDVYRSLFDSVVAGDSLWDSMQQSNEYSALDCGVVRVGEESGNLMAALAFLAEYYERRENQRRTLIGALSYPFIIILVASIVLAFMLTVVIPMFEQVYARMGSELPPITRFIIDFGAAFPSIVIIVLSFAGFLYLFYRKYRHELWFQSLCANAVISLPLLGNLVKKAQLSRFCRIMDLLVKSDVPLLSALDLTGGIITLYPFKKSLIEVSEKVKEGLPVGEALAMYPHLYDRKFLVMMKVGEETNTLDSMFASLSDDYAADLNYQIKQLNNVLEPVLIIVIGGIVTFVLISMYLPMFRLGLTIQ